MQINFYGAAMVDGSLNVGTFTIGNGLYTGYCYYGETQLKTITIVSTFENGVYNLVFSNLTDNGGNAVVEGDLTFTGLISGLTPVDLRTQLAAPSNVTGSADGKTITLSWDPVQGADGYRVKLYSPYEEYKEEIVTTNEYVYEAQLYSKQYSFTIMSYASDTNAQYRSSDDAYANVTTGKDPSIWADVVANNIIWDSSNGAFKMTGEVVSGTAWGHSSDYIRLYFNESDRPGNNSIKVGTYTGCGGTSPQAGQFGARLSLYWGNVTYPSAIGSASTVEVSYDETVGYTIVLTHNNVTYGYKGMPEGWVAPSEGGSGNEGGSGDEGGSDDTGDGFIEMTKLYYDSSAQNIHNFILTNADQSSKLILSFNNQDVLNNWIPAYTYTSKGLSAVNGNSGYFSLQYEDAKINGTSYSLGATGHTLKVLSASNGGNHEMELYVVTSNGTEYKFRFSGSLGL